MKKIIIIGAGEQGRVILDYCNLLGKQVHGFLDDNVTGEINNIPILGKINSQYDENFSYFVAIGDNILRAKIINKLSEKGAEIETIIHPSAIISSSAIIGKGTSIGAGAIICNNTKIGKGVIIDTGAIIEHDNDISDCTNFSPRALTLGGVKIGKYSWIGTGSIIGEDLKVGENSIIGMGAVVTKDIPDNVIAYGVPARIMKENP